MDKSLPGFYNGHAVSPKLTPEQEIIVRDKLAEGATQKDAAEAAGCTIGRVRQYRQKAENARAVKDLQVTTTLIRQAALQNALMEKMVDLIADLESRVTNTNYELRRVSKAVEYQKLALNKKRVEVRDMKAERKRLRAFITAKGLDPDLA